MPVEEMTEQEKSFFSYWKRNRYKEKRVAHRLLWGVPSGITFMSLIMLTLISGWNKQVSTLSLDVFIVICIGLIICSFVYGWLKMTIRWEKKETYYQILKKRYDL